jgi:DNA-binding XRE family transcriptional regulator
VAGISQGTIKAIERGKTDARLSTLRKLARTFTAHGVEFVMEGVRCGVVIKNAAKDRRLQAGQTNPAIKLVSSEAHVAQAETAGRLSWPSILRRKR